jgi:error-prone DNA polymerase
MSTYASLWNKSYYSFLEGASAPEDLVTRAVELGLPALALTDRDGVYGIPAAFVAAREAELKLIVGSQISVEDGTSIVLLAVDRPGYANLCRLITKGRLRSPKGSSSVSWEEVAAHAEGQIALWGGRENLLATSQESSAVAGVLVDAFGDRLYALVARHLEAGDRRVEQDLRRRAERYGLPTVAGLEVLYHTRRRRPLQDVLTCIRRGVTVVEAGLELQSNDRHALPSPRVLAKLFADDPAAVARTLEIAARCTFSLGDLRYRYPAEHLPSGLPAADWFDRLVGQGARDRFGEPVPDDLQARIRRELELIHELEYEGYFLTMHEIVRFCRQEGIICQGRGSAANSVVCYCLKITAVNPREVDLLFERFISRERAEPPDIDLDIEHGRREEVIQHVYEKYGRDRAAMVANVVRFRPRSAIREVGKVLGLPAVNLDRLSKMAGYHGELNAETLTDAGFDPDSPLHGHFVRLVDEIQEFPRHLSIHPGGFLLGHEPVHDLVPIENATMPGRTVIQWDKYDVEALGLFKVDLLGLGALNQLHIAFDLLRKHRNLDLSLARIPRDDRPTFEMLHRADSVGTFQVESRAQMNMLPRLRPDTYYDLVIQVAIIRPGPITGGMLHPYLARRHGHEEVTYPHPSLEPILRKTLGVPLFQEQVMQLAMTAADYSPGEADQLRRDMATWRRHGPIEEHRERLIGRMVEKGITQEFAERVFQQIKGFGEYGFPESHAASFALIAYATSWLKCHHHAAFTCSLLNAQPMGFYSSGTIVEDAKRHDIPVLPIDVTLSHWHCTLEEGVGGIGGMVDVPGSDSGHRPERAQRAMRGAPRNTNHASDPSRRPFAVRMGLRYVKGLNREVGERIVDAQRVSPCRNIVDLYRRARVPVDVLTALAEAGALAAFESDRRKALWVVHGLSKKDRPEQLLLPLVDPVPAPRLKDLSELEVVNWDWKGSGHSTRAHLLEPIRDVLRARGWPTAEEVGQLKHGVRADYVGIVICRQRPHTASGVTFMTLEDETGFVNLVLWNQVWEQYKVPAKTLSLMGVSGKIQTEDGVTHLIVESIWEPQLSGTVVSGTSRDFH